MARVTSSLIEKVQTALISIGTTAVVACCGYLFKVNGALERIEQSLSEQVRAKNDQQARINTIQLKVADHEVAITRIETKQNIKPQ
jgi:hypothetical protein